MTDNPLHRFFNLEKLDGTRTFHFGDAALVTKINMAIAIGRPLLLEGLSGTGKSAVARGAADGLRWALFPKTITSRMEATDLKAEFDAVDRLGDASSSSASDRDKARYVTPGIIWRAYDPDSARQFLLRHDKPVEDLEGEKVNRGRVLLIDEIDKGDLDFANDLLDVFDEGHFDIPVIGGRVDRQGDHKLLVVITSNGERDLSSAFRRRCLSHGMMASTLGSAAAIGQAHLVRRKHDANLLSGDRLRELARFTASGTTEPGDQAAIDVAQFVDLIDATMRFAPAEADWPAFIGAIEQFATERRDAARTGR